MDQGSRALLSGGKRKSSASYERTKLTYLYISFAYYSIGNVNDVDFFHEFSKAEVHRLLWKMIIQVILYRRRTICFILEIDERVADYPDMMRESRLEISCIRLLRTLIYMTDMNLLKKIKS